MGCVTSSGKSLSPKLKDKLLGIFRKIDTDDSKTIDKEETIKFWKSNYAKLNTDLLFKSVDADGNGSISVDEWILFWEEVRRAGYSEKQIDLELDNLMTGGAWVKFKNVGDKLPKGDAKKSKNY